MINLESPHARGLRFWWPMDEPRSTRVGEVLRNADATFNASMDAESWISTVFGNSAVSFDGTAGDKLQVVDQDDLSLPAANATIRLWFQAASWVSSKGLIGKFTSAAANREWGIWTSSTTNGLQFFRYDGAGFAGSNTLANAAFFDGTPTFVAARTNASGSDGTIEAVAWKPSLGLQTGTPVSVGTAPWRTTGPGNLAIGAYQDDATGNEFACAPWDICIHDVALTDLELLDIAVSDVRSDLGDGPYVPPRAFVAAAGGFVPYPNPRYALGGGIQPLGGGVS